MNKAYGVLSGHYEELAASDGYREWAEYVLKEVGENAKGKTGCDAACGSGYFTRALKRAGYSVEGADKSEDMLKVAQSKSVSEGLSINYYLCDLKNFRSFSKLDFITVINDGVNYLSAQDIPKAFAAFHKATHYATRTTRSVPAYVRRRASAPHPRYSPSPYGWDRR